MTVTIKPCVADQPDARIYVVNDAHCSDCGSLLAVGEHVTRWHGGRAMATGAFVRQVKACECGGRYVFALELLLGIATEWTCARDLALVAEMCDRRAA